MSGMPKNLPWSLPLHLFWQKSQGGLKTAPVREACSDFQGKYYNTLAFNFLIVESLVSVTEIINERLSFKMIH